MITYRVGSRNESAGLTGATHFLEHLMFKGSDRFNRSLGTSVFEVLQNVGAQVNATTWVDRTNYYELMPNEHLALAVELEADRMRNALLLREDVESERSVILNELDRGENDPIRSLYQGVWSTAYQAHPYHHPTIGWRSDVESVQDSDLRAFYDTFYWPGNATVSIIGDCERNEALDLLRKAFGDIPPAPVSSVHRVTREPDQNGERRLLIQKPGQVGSVMVAYKAPEATHRDAPALDVLATILSSGKSSRLYRRLVHVGLASTVSASFCGFHDPGLFYVLALLVPGASHRDVEEAIQEVIREAAEHEPSGAELERARNQLRALEAYGRDGPFAVAAQLNEAIAAGDWKLYTTFLDRIDEVTVSDVRRVTEAHLRRSRSTIGWYEPQAPQSNDSPEQP
jgi:zinc protease